jgi:hypothetical protein
MNSIAAIAIDNASAVVSPNIYVTGSGRSTNGIFTEWKRPVVMIMPAVIDIPWPAS